MKQNFFYKTFFCVAVMLLSLNVAIFSQKAHDSVNFRGTRTAEQAGALKILSVNAEKDSSGYVILNVQFSKTVNPRSISGSNFLANGKSTLAESKITFSSDGKTCRITTKTTLIPQNLTVKDVSAFDGAALEENPVNISVKGSK